MDTNTDQVKPRWFIDLDWYQQNNRSFLALAQERLCLKCRERLKTQKKEASAAELFSSLRDCCSKTPGFITHKLPILESIFRIFLANSNQPLNLEELQKQLNELHSGDVHHASVEILSRLLSSDQYYGLRQASD